MHRYLITMALSLLLFSNSSLAIESTSSTALSERVKEKVLENGLRIVVAERHFAPVFFTLVSFRVGSANEMPDRSGLSHFLEHMLGKGTETIGTKNYKKEKPIMEELEVIATKIRTLEQILENWRLEAFDEHSISVKTNLPEEERQAIATDEAAAWRAIAAALPSQTAGLPEDWQNIPWMLSDRDYDYWTLYHQLLEYRARLADLIVEQRQYIVQSELDGIYDVMGAKRHNAFTSNDQTGFTVGLPSNCLELWMYLSSDRFQNPVFREFYSEREVIIEESHMYANEPWSVLMQALNQAAFRAHPYSRPIIGWISDIKTTLRSDMEDHFERYYAPNNCQITIAGDVDADEVFELAEKYFGSWEPKEVVDEVTVKEPEQKGEIRVQAEFDAEPQLMIGYHAPVSPHPDSYPLQMASMILSQGRTSRFYRSIFVEQKLTSRAPWASSASARYDDLFVIGATPKAPHTVEEVEDAIYREMDKLKMEKPSERELERVRKAFQVYQLARLRSNQWLAYSLAGAYVTQGDWRTIDENISRLVAVTPEDVQRVVGKYLIKSNRTVATLVKPEETVAAEEMGGVQ